MTSNNRIDPLAVTPTVARQTPKNEFGEVLKTALEKGSSLVSGALMNSVPGVGAVSAAVSSVSSAMTAASGIVNVGGSSAPATGATHASAGAGGTIVGTTLNDPAHVGAMGDSIRQMRAEADRSFMVQVQMQNESREYNTLTNVLKVRHESAKASINNIR